MAAPVQVRLADEHGLANALDIRGFVTAHREKPPTCWKTGARTGGKSIARIAAEKAKAARKALAAAEAAEKARTAEAEAVSKTAKVQPATKPDANAAIAKAPPTAAVPDEKTRAARALAEAEAAVEVRRSGAPALRRRPAASRPKSRPDLLIAPETGEEDGSGPADQDGEETRLLDFTEPPWRHQRSRSKFKSTQERPLRPMQMPPGSKPAATDGTRTEAFLQRGACRRLPALRHDAQDRKPTPHIATISTSTWRRASRPRFAIERGPAGEPLTRPPSIPSDTMDRTHAAA